MVRVRVRVRVNGRGRGPGWVRQATVDLVADELDEVRRERVRAAVLRDAPQRRGKDLVRIRIRFRVSGQGSGSG